jgi:hypothetical protein
MALDHKAACFVEALEASIIFPQVMVVESMTM